MAIVYGALITEESTTVIRRHLDDTDRLHRAGPPRRRQPPPPPRAAAPKARARAAPAAPSEPESELPSEQDEAEQRGDVAAATTRAAGLATTIAQLNREINRLTDELIQVELQVGRRHRARRAQPQHQSQPVEEESSSSYSSIPTVDNIPEVD